MLRDVASTQTSDKPNLEIQIRNIVSDNVFGITCPNFTYEYLRIQPKGKWNPWEERLYIVSFFFIIKNKCQV